MLAAFWQTTLGKIFTIFSGFVLLAALVAYALFYESDLSREELLPEYTTKSSKFAQLPNGASMHYRDEGNPEGPVLVLIHGGFGSLHNWEPWVERLGASHLRIISMDLLGHGLTGAYPGQVYDRHTERDAIHQLLQQLGIRRYAVAGNSFGGGIALELALAYPDEVEALILLNSEGLPNGEDGYDIAMFRDDAPITPESPQYKTLTLAERIGCRFIGPNVVATSLDTMVADRKIITDTFVQRNARLLRHAGNREAQLLMFRQGMALIAKNGKMDLLPKLSSIKAPTLIIQGEEDTLVPMRVAERFAKEIPNAELMVVPGAAHLPMIEKPEATATKALSFLKGVYGH